jgi:protein involved in polysaccharide export with SLBB domain
MRRIGRVLLAGLVIFLSACGASSPPAGREGVTMADEEVVGFGPKDSTYVDPSYRLGPGDVVQLKFLFDRNLDSEITVRPDGGINLPILGDLIVAGKTPGNLATQISEAYGRYYTNPQLSVNLTKFAPPQAYVLGEVRYPKAVEIRPGMTVLGAIADAGGQNEFADLGNVVLIRRTALTQAVARRFNPGRFARGDGMTSDFFLQDYDIIYVPKSFIGRLTTMVDLIFNHLVAIPVFYLRGWEAFNTDLVYNRPLTPNNSQPSTENP